SDELVALAAGWQRENTEFEFAQGDWADDQIGIVLAQPPDDARGGRRLCRLAQHVGVHHILHERAPGIVSVDSEGKDSNQPFSVQARSHSTSPGLPGTGNFFSKYSPS